VTEKRTVYTFFLSKMIIDLCFSSGLLDLRSSAFSFFAQLRELSLESPREDRKAAPGFGVEVFVIEVQRWGIALAFPLVTAPQPEEPLDPDGQLLRVILLPICAESLPHFDGHLLVADRSAFDRVEHWVRHKVALVGLIFGRWTKLGGRLLGIDNR